MKLSEERRRELLRKMQEESMSFDLCGIRWSVQSRYNEPLSAYAEINGYYQEPIQLMLGRSNGKHLDIDNKHLNKDGDPRTLNLNTELKDNIDDLCLAFSSTYANILELDLEDYLDFKDDAYYVLHINSYKELEESLKFIKKLFHV